MSTTTGSHSNAQGGVKDSTSGSTNAGAAPRVGAPGEARALMRELQRTLGEARDDQVSRVLAVVDALPDRGVADALIAPFRHRLTALKPPRPLTFSRLLFMPLDPVIIAATAWRRGSLGIPRTAILPIASEVRKKLDGVAAEIDVLIAGRSADDGRAVRGAGGLLWPAAADILDRAPMPHDWASATGLNRQDHEMVAHACATILRGACEVHDIATRSADGEEIVPADLGRIVVAASANPLEVGMLLAILLTRLPTAQNVISSIGDTAGGKAEWAGRLAVDTAIDFMLETIETGTPASLELYKAAQEALRIANLLDGLEQPGPCFRPSRKTRVEALRRRVDAQQRERFDLEIEEKVFRPTAALGAEANDREIEDVEAWIRDLRHFEVASRRLGGGDHYDRVLRSTAAKLCQLQLPRVDRIRLAELMLGAEAAMRLVPDRAFPT